MRNRTHHQDFTSDLEFYRAGFPLASLDRVRPAPRRDQTRTGDASAWKFFGRLTGGTETNR